MTDTTDDIAEEISFQSFEDDCKLLGSLFNDVLQREVGTDFMEKIERTRILAQVFCFYFWLLSLSVFKAPLWFFFWSSVREAVLFFSDPSGELEWILTQCFLQGNT